jgi:HD-like signal output (HDOD) protein
LPDGVCHTILNHHNPSQAEQFAVIAHMICAADMIANINGFGIRDGQGEFKDETESTMILNLSPQQMDIAWANTLDNVIEITNAFA